MLRVSVEGGGCSGFQYKFDIEQRPGRRRPRVARDGATVLIDPVSLGYLAGSEIDFVDDLIGASFSQQSERQGVLRLRHQLLALTHAAKSQLAAKVGASADFCGVAGGITSLQRSTGLFRRHRRRPPGCVRHLLAAAARGGA